ncbi:MAG TPA: EAL domain-containing protein, partial [Ideonella sp.]|nr:EAL domain-containing protein [Ideonella sp.]
QQERERLSRAMLDHSPQLIGLLSPSGEVLRINQSAGRWMGTATTELTGQPLWAMPAWAATPDQIGLLRDAVRQAGNGQACRVDLRIAPPGGELRHAELSLRPVRKTPEGPVEHLLLEARDVTVRKQGEDKLLLAAAVFEQAREGIMITDSRGVIVSVNQAFTDITGFDASEVQGQYPAMLTTALEDPHMHRQIRSSLLRLGHWQGELRSMRKDGAAYTAWVSMSRRADAGGRTSHLIGILNDITHSKDTEQKLLKQAHYDSLTELPNRHLMEDRILLAINAAHRGGEPFALMFMDLNQFRAINDNFSHRAGDAVLLEMSHRLRDGLRDSDTVARLGGDEFAVLLPVTDAEGAAQVASKLLERVAQPCMVLEHELSLTLSVGIAMFPNDGETVEALTRCADTAMYRAKQEGRGTYRFFAAGMQQRSVRHLQVEAALRRAVERDELQLHYQPQLDLHSGEVVGAEALVRWRHPELGLVSPGEFIPLAESSGQIMVIGEWVLRTAVKQMKAWIDGGLAPRVVAVNLSAIQFRDPGLPDLVKAILDEAGLPAHCLELELTESVATGNPTAAIAMMDRLYSMGVRLSIDDFGTGYSSLNYLKRFRIHTLKIDQSFVRDIGTDADDRAIVQAIVQMAHALNLTTIAEGVETEEQAQFLRAHGCDMVQGYRYCRPVVPEAALAWMLASEAAEAAL